MLERRYLVLEDGTYYEGYKLGSNDLSVGEIVFNDDDWIPRDDIRPFIYWSNHYIHIPINR